jgi:hypothetical protein
MNFAVTLSPIMQADGAGPFAGVVNELNCQGHARIAIVRVSLKISSNSDGIPTTEAMTLRLLNAT